MTDIQAALGLSQLDRLSWFLGRRNQLAEIYDRELQGLPLELPTVQPENRSAFHLYVVHLLLEEIRSSYIEIFDELRERGIGVNLHYLPVHLQPYYRSQGFESGQFPEAEKHGRCAISLPLYPALTEEDQEHVIRTLREIL
jgi:dTDP-4-amino-4,6-dideoxygalactose transaminase